MEVDFRLQSPNLSLEFEDYAKRKGRSDAEIEAVWNLLFGFQGYAFCRAHSTAYGVEAYQAAHLKHYHPAEFLGAVLTHEKGFYSPLAYTLEARRLGISFLSPDVNASRKAFRPEYREGRAFLRVPLWKVKDLSVDTAARIDTQRTVRPFDSLSDFYRRVGPTKVEAQNLIRAGSFDVFGDTRTTQFWHLQQLADWPCGGDQGVLFGATDRPLHVPQVALTEPSRMDRLRDEQDLLGFTVSGHPLDLFPSIPWDKYCPIAELGNNLGQRVKVCGLTFRGSHRVPGERPAHEVCLAMRLHRLCRDGAIRHHLSRLRHGDNQVAGYRSRGHRHAV